jgi:hypothetical protein
MLEGEELDRFEVHVGGEGEISGHVTTAGVIGRLPIGSHLDAARDSAHLRDVPAPQNGWSPRAHLWQTLLFPAYFSRFFARGHAAQTRVCLFASLRPLLVDNPGAS